MEAGQELDALIAEKVMGQTDYEHGELEETSGGDPACSRCGMVGMWSDNIFGDTRCIKRYSTNIAAAWEVVNKIQDGNNWEFTIQSDSGEWEVRCDAHISRRDYNESQYNARAMSAPHAICLVALKAIGYEEVTK